MDLKSNGIRALNLNSAIFWHVPGQPSSNVNDIFERCRRKNIRSMLIGREIQTKQKL